MFESETEQLMTLIRQRTIGTETSIGVRHIQESRVPTGIKQFFKGDVEWKLFLERSGKTVPSRFQYNIPEIKLLQEQIDVLLVNNYVYPQEEFQSVLDTGVHFLFNYLCRPQWTLLSFLFETGNSVTTPVIHQKIRYCRDYAYFGEILLRYVEQRGIGELTYEQTKPILSRIDVEVLKHLPTTELTAMTKPIFDFVAYSRDSLESDERHTVPIRALMYFFEDKGMTAIVDVLKLKRDSEKRKELTLAELTTLVEGLKLPPPVIPAVPEMLEGSPAPETSSSSAYSSTTTIINPPRPESESSETPAPQANIFSIDEERSMIRTIFNREEEAYQALLKKILESPSWNDAALIIDHYFTMHDVEPFTKEAILFTNRLQNYFATND